MLSSLGLYVGTLQVLWFLAIACWSGFGAACLNLQLLAIACRLATYSSFGALSWLVGVGLGRTVPLGPCYGLLEWVWGCMSAPYNSFGALLWPVGVGVGLYVGSYNSFGALFWPVGVGLGLYVGNLQFFWGFVMACWSGFGAVCRQPTVLLGPCCGLLGWVWGCMSATYSSFGALLWPVGVGLGLYVGNLQFFWGFVMACWSGFGVGLGLYVGNLQLLAIACRLATYSSFGALSWLVGVGLGLYVGNLQFFWGLVMACWNIAPCYCLCRFYLWFLAVACWSGFGALGNLHVLGSFERVSCCRLATCRSCWVVQRNFGCLTTFYGSWQVVQPPSSKYFSMGMLVRLTMWGPPVISWFTNPHNYSYKYHKP